MMKRIVLMISIFVTGLTAFSQEDPEIISLYTGSKLEYDDDIGFETFYYLTGEKSHKTIDGNTRRQFCSAPEGVSPYEIVKNYEKAISSKGGTVIYLSRDAYRYTDEKTGERVWFMRDLFTNGRLKPLERGWAYAQLPNEANDYVAGKISTSKHDIYISVAAAVVDDATYYTLVTVLAEPMDLGNVTLNVLNEGIAKNGRVPIYDIFFDTGKSEVKAESSAALKTIADYLKVNTGSKFLIVGHTDNTGDFDANLILSNDRAKAVIQKLITDYGINSSQLKPFGVGSASPQMSNETEDGRARNRRVELVEL
ncbi:MAG: OmpA family protein [Bacteroidales bacterium]|jgi:outer membrane protein OmpA-like peptidoglycan-associated protein